MTLVRAEGRLSCTWLFVSDFILLTIPFCGLNLDVALFYDLFLLLSNINIALNESNRFSSPLFSGQR